MQKLFKYVVVMTALSCINVVAMRKTQSMRDGLSSLDAHGVLQLQKKLRPSKSAKHLYPHDKVTGLNPDTWFEQLKHNELQRNAQKFSSCELSKLDEFLKNTSNDIQSIQRSNRLLNNYFYCEKFKQEHTDQTKVIKQTEQFHIKCAGSTYARALEIAQSPLNQVELDKELLEKDLNRIRYLRKHTLHAKFGLHSNLTRENITKDMIYACQKYLHVDLTYAELERRMVSMIKNLKTSSFTCCPNSSNCNVS